MCSAAKARQEPQDRLEFLWERPWPAIAFRQDRGHGRSHTKSSIRRAPEILHAVIPLITDANDLPL
jgi:hypothetical protein